MLAWLKVSEAGDVAAPNFRVAGVAGQGSEVSYNIKWKPESFKNNYSEVKCLNHF